MARIPYQAQDIAEPKDVVEPIRARRGGRLLNLDRILLHSPAFAHGWNAFFRAVRSELSLSPRLRELAICAVATLNGADYEFHHHAAELLKTGASEEQVAALRRMETTDPAAAALFSAEERAVIKFALEMTRQVRVGDATFAELRAVLPSDQQVVELTGVIASYNMVSRVLVALQVDIE